jgi:hypothetical protein
MVCTESTITSEISLPRASMCPITLGEVGFIGDE